MRLLPVVLLAAGLGLTSTACTVCAPHFAVDCASSDDCPVGFVCQQRLCVARTVDAGAGLDASAGDGGLADAVRTDRGSDAAAADHASVDGAGIDQAAIDGAGIDQAAVDGAGSDRAVTDGAGIDQVATDGAGIDQAAVDGAVADTAAAEAGVADGGVFVDAAGDAAPLESGSPDLPAFDAGVGPALFAIHPAIGKTGDWIELEGIFPAGSVSVVFARKSVDFPANPATSRLRLPVPPGAGSGPVQVTVNGVTSNSVPFRYTTFAPRLGYLSPNYEQTNAARSMPALTHRRTRGIPLVTSSYLYVIGGVADNVNGRTRTRARIYGDGTLGGFAIDSGYEMAERRSGAAAALVGNRLYLLGGHDSATLRTVETATIDADGVLGAFSAADPMQNALQDAEAVVIGRYLYLIGGRHYDSPIDPLTQVLRAPIGVDLGLGPFEYYTDLAVPRDRTAVAVVGNRLYVIGGTEANDSIEMATIEYDGDLGGFAAYQVAFTGRRSAAIAVFPTELCLLGGERGATDMTSVECAAIAENGDLSAFTARGMLPLARTSPAAAVVHNRLYLLGGASDAGGSEVRLADLLQAPITFGAQLGAFVEMPGSPLSMARRDPACAVIGDTLYVTGGKVRSNPLSDAELVAGTTEVLTVGGDGTLHATAGAVFSLDQPRSGHRLAVTDGQLLAIGGEADLGKLGTAVSMAIDDGSPVGIWVAQPDLDPARSHFSAAIIGNELFVAGGATPVEIATQSVLRTDLPTINWQAGPSLFQPRAQVGTAVLGSRLYAVGGFDAGAFSLWTADVAFHDGTALGSFSEATPAFAYSRADPMLASLGNTLWVLGGYEWWEGYLAAAPGSERIQQNGDGTWSGRTHETTPALPTAATQGGCLIELSNSLHLLGGWDGTVSTDRYWTAAIQ